MRYAAEMGMFFFQLYDGCMDRHGAFYVSHNPGRNQKQADTEQYQTDSEKESHGAYHLSGYRRSCSDSGIVALFLT